MVATYARTKKAVPLPFAVPAPFEPYLRTAVDKMEGLRKETKTAAARVERSVVHAAENVRVQAEVLASDPREFMETMVRDGKNLRTTLRKNVDKVTDQLSREATRVADEVTHRVTATLEGVVRNTLHKLNVPTRAELQALSRKLDDMTAKPVRKARKAPVRRARKV